MGGTLFFPFLIKEKKSGGSYKIVGGGGVHSW